jgi:drug/metabolite transporter (DMT)-like permease
MAAPVPPTAPAAPHGFAPLDWALLTGVALTWGASFLLIDIGVDHFEPGLVALLRLVFGVVVLALVPAARRPVPRSEWPLIALLGLVWMALPFLLFPYAEQRIDSSLAGMINAAAPLFGAVVTALLVRRLPGRMRTLGLIAGFLGVVAITGPEIDGAEASALGVALVLLATVGYGVAFNITGPLQQRNGALPIILRAQLVSLVIEVPVGLAAIDGSSFAWSSLLATAFLGAVGTALAYVWFSVLVGRVGPARGSVTLYFMPPVAIVLGAILRDETISAAAIAGTAVVLAGAYVVSRSR